MDFDQVSRVLEETGLGGDPAFEDVGVTIRPINKQVEGHDVLALYYPDSELIVLPPESTDVQVLHEFGHRHGHFHFDDLSEHYAEHYRLVREPVYQTKPDRSWMIPAGVFAAILGGMTISFLKRRHG